jgi:hypothetical protein
MPLTITVRKNGSLGMSADDAAPILLRDPVDAPAESPAS